MSKARLVITAVVVEGRSQAEVARSYGVSQPWISRLLARLRSEADAAIEPRPRRPRGGGAAAFEPRSRGRRSSPNAPPAAVVERILALRTELSDKGLDAGPHT